MTDNTTATVPANIAADILPIMREAAERNVNAAEDGATALASFESSARGAWDVIRAGGKPAHLAALTAEVAVERGIAERGDDGKIRITRPGVSSSLYTTPTAVGWHWRTGAFLALPGDLYLKPEGSSRRHVIADATTTQAVLREISQPLVAKVLTAAHADGLDRAAAWKMITEAVEAAALKAAASLADGDDDATDDDAAPGKAPWSVARACTAMTGNLSKIHAHVTAGGSFDDADATAWDAFVSQVLAVEAMRAAQSAESEAVAAATDALADDDAETVAAVA